jgi:hypothetical protein
LEYRYKLRYFRRPVPPWDVLRRELRDSLL